MSKENLFKKAIANRQQFKADDPTPEPETPPDLPAEISSAPARVPPGTKPRGRPATGKRSDDAWIGRTFYVQRETDLDAETELLLLKRQGVEIDKSELVDRLLAAWVKWRQGEDLEGQFSDISPIRKSKKS